MAKLGDLGNFLMAFGGFLKGVIDKIGQNFESNFDWLNFQFRKGIQKGL